MIRRKEDIIPVPLANVFGGNGTVMMEKLLDAPKEMLNKGRAYVRHTLTKGVSIGKHIHQNEMESMVIVSGCAMHIINGEEQMLGAGDVIAAMPGDTHEIACCGEEPLVLITQVLYN